MKKLIALVVAISLVLGLLAACTTSQTTPQPTPQDPPANTGKHVSLLRVGTTYQMEGFNVMGANGSFRRMAYNSFTVAPFVERDENGQPSPCFMTEWEISDDLTVLTGTFATDQGIIFHDGTPVTMDDVIFSIEYRLNVVKDSIWTGLIRVERIDETHARLIFDGPYAYRTLGSIAQFGYVYPKHIWENVTDYLNYAEEDAVIGCGPYKLVNIDRDAQIISYEKVADTYLGREITVDRVDVHSYSSLDSLAMALINGEVDAMYNFGDSLDPSLRPTITGVDGLNPGTSMCTGGYQLVFGFNVAPTNDIKFRQAATYALDYELLATVIGGEDGEIAGTGIISPANIGFNASLPKNQQDQERAKKTLDDAGYIDANGDGWRELPGGGELVISIAPYYNPEKSALYLRMIEIISSNLGEIGVKAVLDEEAVRNSAYNQSVRTSAEYQMYVSYTTPASASYRTAIMYVLSVAGSGAGWGSCTDPKALAAYEDAMNSGSTEEYAQKVYKLQELNGEQFFGVALAWGPVYFPYRTDKIGGWVYVDGWGPINCLTWYALYEK